jgi:hypothetical protein
MGYMILVKGTNNYKQTITAEANSLQWRIQEYFSGRGGSTNLVEDRGQRKWGSRGGSPLVRGSTQFANE